MYRFLRLALVIILVAGSSSLFALDPFLGSWRLDLRSSHYPKGAAPMAMTIDMSADGQSVHYHSATSWRGGIVAIADYTAGYDGTPVLVSGNHGLLLPVALTRVNARVVEATYTRGFQTMAVSRRSVSPDGQTLIATTMSKDASGRNVVTTAVFRRQPAPPPAPIHEAVRDAAAGASPGLRQ